MGLNRLVAAGLRVADRATGSLQLEVEWKPWVGLATTGEVKPTYGTSVYVQALVEDDQRDFRLTGGDVLTSRTKLTILRPVEPNGATGRDEPIDTRDLFVVKGKAARVLHVDAMLNPATGRGYYAIVWLE